VVSALRLAHLAASHGVMDDLHKLSSEERSVPACG
jgi:phosphate acyltransferase